MTRNEPPSDVYRDCQCGKRDLNIIRGRWPRHTSRAAP